MSISCKSVSLRARVLGKALEKGETWLLSREGVETKLKSPPTIIWGDRNFSRTVKNEEKKEAGASLGA